MPIPVFQRIKRIRHAFGAGLLLSFLCFVSGLLFSKSHITHDPVTLVLAYVVFAMALIFNVLLLTRQR